MSDMPSWWYGGNPNTIFQNDLAQNTAALSNNQNFYGGLAGVRGQDQASLNNAYGPQGFGGATAQAAYAGAAFGRGVSPSSPAAVAAENGAPPEQAPSVFDTGTSAVPYSPPPGSFSPSPNYTGGRGLASIFDTGAPPVPYSPPMGSYSPPPVPAAPNFNQTFSSFTQDGDVSRNRTALDAVNQYSGVGTGVAPAQPYSLPPAVNPFEHAFGSLPEGGGFADRFGFRNAGTPSEYTTSPYTDVSGTTHQPSQMPPGFSTPFSADNPGGALTRQMRGGTPAPIMNAGEEPPEDKGFAPPSPFDLGAPPMGPTMGPFMRGVPGGGVGSQTAPPGFAPSSPFSAGTAPFPFSGGYQGSMRDRIASAMTGPTIGATGIPVSTTGPTISGPPMVNGGPQTPPPPSAPAPTQPQMSDAWSRLKVGPGGPGVSSIAQQTPPPQSAYAPINQAIYDIGNVSRPGMFDNTAQPLSSMFSPGTYRGR